jgi:hypothetical protein
MTKTVAHGDNILFSLHTTRKREMIPYSNSMDFKATNFMQWPGLTTCLSNAFLHWGGGGAGNRNLTSYTCSLSVVEIKAK